MNLLINKDTKIYCSFSKNAGNKGCEFFNKAFSDYKINAIYKSFSIEKDWEFIDALKAAGLLRFSGCAIAMPYKKIAYDYVDIKDESAKKSLSINTILIGEKLVGYNTDYCGAKKILSSHRNNYKKIFILGSNGGLSGAVQAASLDLDFEIEIIGRGNWNKIIELKNSLIYNCTPLSLTPDESNKYIDCLIGTYYGNLLHKYQSHKQFELYTGIKINEI